MDLAGEAYCREVSFEDARVVWGNGCISRRGFLDPVQTNEMHGRVSSGSLDQIKEGWGRASGLSAFQLVGPRWATVPSSLYHSSELLAASPSM
jgi:hypothetical protein